MSPFNRAVRPPPTVSDEAIERYLAALHDHLDPDPLFRRRLRTEVVNRFVAAREGIGVVPERRFGRGRMGRLGRACLYAAFTLATTAATVLAVSQEALPGEPLYALKLRVEQVRMDVVPEHLRGELAAIALEERLAEMGRLAEAGDIGRALAMTPAIEREYRRLQSLSETAEPARAARIERHMLVLASLIDRLPTPARSAVERSFAGSAPMAPPVGDPSGGRASGGHGAGGPDGAAAPEPTSRPDRTPRPSPTPKPDHRPDPDRVPRPSSSPEPEATDETSD